MDIAILGCGVMGRAFAEKLLEGGHRLTLCDRDSRKGKELASAVGGSFALDPKEAISSAELILLAIKPKDLEEMVAQLGTLKGQILFSILTSTSVSELKSHFPGGQVLRGMPNLALIHGESVIALVDEPALDEETKQRVSALLEGMGMVFWTQEGKIDAITALAGSGPAFVIAIVEAMVDAAIMMGLRASEAQEMALQTMVGAISLMRNCDGHPGQVRWQISAPSGTTSAGICALEDSGVRAGVIDTLLATFQRAKEISCENHGTR